MPPGPFTRTLLELGNASPYEDGPEAAFAAAAPFVVAGEGVI
jgi:hypothetical protein